MKSSCERCGRQLQSNDDARICSYDCTFCTDCAVMLDGHCSNCGGALAAPGSAM